MRDCVHKNGTDTRSLWSQMSLAQIHKNDFGNIGYIISVGHEKQVILGVGWNRTLPAVSKQYIFVLSLKMFDMLMFCWPRLKPTEKKSK